MSEIRLSNISICVTIAVNTLDVLAETFKIPGLNAISNTTQSLLKLVQTVKQDKNECAELMEHTHQLLSAIIGVYIKSDTGVELAPSVLDQIAKFTGTLHKIHIYIEAQQSGSKVKKFFRQGERSVLLKNCKSGLQQGLDFFQLKAVDIMANAREMQEQAQIKHQEILDIIETMSLDSVSFISYSNSYASANSISMLPAEPKIFYGRESELAHILKLFNQGTPRIAILGAGGMGKTSLAQTVLHHEQIITKYHGNRLFIACDVASSKVELAALIGAHLGMKPGKDLSRAVVQHFSDGPPSLLILDNLETAWELAESRKTIEEFLSLLTDITNLGLMITMRGAERPAKVQWTRPFLLPLQPLSQDAAQKMFIDITDEGHSMEEVDQVLFLTGNMPLSISLLAHLVDVEGCSVVLSRWKTEKTSLISEGADRRSNLELSISLSLSSPRIISMPHSQELLALLSILPDGLSDVELMQSKLPIQDILGCKVALLRTALAYSDGYKRLKVLAPVREYVAKFSPPTDQIIQPLFKHFHELLELYITNGGKTSAALVINRISSNYSNIQNVLRHGLHPDHPELANSIYCTCDFNRFSLRIGHGATPLLKDIINLLPSLENHRAKVYFITEVLQSWRHHSIPHVEKLIGQALEHLKQLDDWDIGSRFHGNLGFYYYESMEDLTKALQHTQTALSLGQLSGNYRRQAGAHDGLSYIEWLGGHYTVGKVHAQEAQRLAKMSGDLHQEARGLYLESICWQLLGNYRQCISLTVRARALLALCGMAHGDIDHHLVKCQAQVHRVKSEYIEAYTMQSQTLRETTDDSYHKLIAMKNIAEIEVWMGVPSNEIQQKIDASLATAQATGDAGFIADWDFIQADLNFRDGNMSPTSFHKCLRAAWGKNSELMGYCLEHLADHTHWETSDHPSSWSTVFLAHSLKIKDRLGVYKALQFLGDLFLRKNDKLTAISLFTLALDGFTHMDVHRNRAECMIRLGDISKRHGDLLMALELWETARPLFERSSQVKRVQDVNERLVGIGEDVKEQHRSNLVQLAELKGPTGKEGGGGGRFI